jgi:fatty-acyl-CoA synthase
VGQPAVSWIDAHAARTPDRTALVDLATGRSHTYAQLSRRVRSVAAGLAARGIGRGDRVAVLSRNDARTFEVLHACTHLGAICVLLNWRLSEAELVTIAADARPALLVVESAAAATGAALKVPEMIVWGSDDGDPDGYEELATTAVEGWAPTEVDEDAPWTILYTSGTTVLPTFHVAGLALFANATLLMGGSVVVMRQFDPAVALALLTATDEPFTHFCGVPANYQFISSSRGSPPPTCTGSSRRWAGHPCRNRSSRPGRRTGPRS